MDVKLIEQEDAAATQFRDLLEGVWFVFAHEPQVICRRIANGGHHTEHSRIAYYPTCESDWARKVIPLELAGTAGQTLLLRRAE